MPSPFRKLISDGTVARTKSVTAGEPGPAGACAPRGRLGPGSVHVQVRDAGCSRELVPATDSQNLLRNRRGLGSRDDRRRRRPLEPARGRARTDRDRPLHGLAQRRARARLRRLRRAPSLVGDRPRSVLGIDLGLLRDPRACAVRARARLERAAGSRVVSRRAAELRGAHGRPRRGRERRRGGRVLADTRTDRADLRRPPRPGRACARGDATARRRPRRPGGRVRAEHPGDARRVPRRGEPRRDLGDVPARVRRTQRRRPAGPARADAAARGDRLRVG